MSAAERAKKERQRQDWLDGLNEQASTRLCRPTTSPRPPAALLLRRQPTTKLLTCHAPERKRRARAQIKGNEAKREAAARQRAEQAMQDENEWREKGMHTWFGRQGGGAPMRGISDRLGLGANAAVEPPSWASGASAQPVSCMGGGSSYDPTQARKAGGASKG